MWISWLVNEILWFLKKILNVILSLFSIIIFSQLNFLFICVFFSIYVLRIINFCTNYHSHFLLSSFIVMLFYFILIYFWRETYSRNYGIMECTNDVSFSMKTFILVNFFDVVFYFLCSYNFSFFFFNSNLLLFYDMYFFLL